MQNESVKPSNYISSVVIIAILFFIFGFVTWLNGALMPFLQTACEITPFQLIFIPAAYTRIFSIFLIGLFVLGTGLALLQTAVNPFITIIGPSESAAVRISFMGICNKFAGFISPLVLSALVMHGMEKFSDDKLNALSGGDKDVLLNELASRLVGPYVVMAIVLFLFGVIVKFSGLPDKIDVEDDHDGTLDDFIKQIPQALKIPHVLYHGFHDFRLYTRYCFYT